MEPKPKGILLLEKQEAGKEGILFPRGICVMTGIWLEQNLTEELSGIHSTIDHLTVIDPELQELPIFAASHQKVLDVIKGLKTAKEVRISPSGSGWLEFSHDTEIEEVVNPQINTGELTSSLIAALNHNIRTPLATLQGYSSSMARNGYSPATKDQLQQIIQSIKRISGKLEALHVPKDVDPSDFEVSDLEISINPEGIPTITPVFSPKPPRREEDLPKITGGIIFTACDIL